METLAFLHVAEAYEDPESKELVVWRNGLGVLRSLNQLKLSGRSTFLLVGTICSTVLFSLATITQAFPVQFGDQGADVSYLQTLLRNAGYTGLPSTGFFGQATQSAVIDYQTRQGLVADGIAGQQTIASLEGFITPRSPGGVIGSPGGVIDRGTVPATGTLRFGSEGPAVSRLQDRLRALGFYAGDTTGYYGAITERAVLDFQVSRGLAADGIAGPVTLDALNTAALPLSNRPNRPIGGPALLINNSPGTPTPIDVGSLRFGSTGERVRQLQLALTELGFYTGPITGNYGPLTEEAVRRFQQSRDILADGVANSQTLTALGV
jgi:peptidoglycan hydrolase-like protein with peptidoglycan-binding domain